MRKALKIWLVSLVLTALGVWFSYFWLDRPIALLVRASLGSMQVPAKLIDSPISSSSFISACAFVMCGLVAVSGRRFSTFGTAISMCVVSLVATILVKDQLKFVFGRTWPESWAPGVTSFLADGAYGFHFFRYGQSFESFPSGHAAVVAAVLSIPWIMCPRLRVVAAICIILADFILVMLNLHFLSDVIAGSFIGFSMGLFTISLWRADSSHVGGVKSS